MYVILSSCDGMCYFAERREYILLAIFSSEGYFASEVTKSTEPSKVQHAVYTPAEVAPSKKSAAIARGSDGDIQDMIDQVRSIFPDYGKLFVTAALKVPSFKSP